MLKYEDKVAEIENEINKRKPRWRLSAISWMDFDDVKQLLRIHIQSKWELWDQKRPFLLWVNKVITNQMINLVRNKYDNIARPCLKCAANEGGDLCRIYETQCSRCPIYKKWENSKKSKYDIEFSTSIHSVCETQLNSFQDESIFNKIPMLHKKIMMHLSPLNKKIYKSIYIDYKSELQTAEDLGYNVKRGTKSPGYKQIEKAQKNIISIAKKVLEEGDILE